jgi:hypothetical protein
MKGRLERALYKHSSTVENYRQKIEINFLLTPLKPVVPPAPGVAGGRLLGCVLIVKPPR